MKIKLQIEKLTIKTVPTGWAKNNDNFMPGTNFI